MRASHCPSGEGAFHSYGAYQCSQGRAEVCALQHWCSREPSQLRPRHTPGWLSASTGHVASNLCSVHTNRASVLNMWLRAFVTTAYGILSHWPKCALKQQPRDGARLIYMEWRLGPPLLFFSILFLLPVFKKKPKPGKCSPVIWLPTQSCCKVITFAICNFLKILPLFHKDARASKQNASMKKLNHNLKAWRRVSETDARRNSQVWQIFARLWVLLSHQKMGWSSGASLLKLTSGNK